MAPPRTVARATDDCKYADRALRDAIGASTARALLAQKFRVSEITYTYYPTFERAARALRGDDVRAERGPRDRGVD